MTRTRSDLAARIAVLVLVLAIALRAHRSLDAPAVEPARAEALLALHAALFDDRPRPSGSPAASEARARVARALAERGCPPREHVAWSCRPGRCARVVNLWCRIGPASGPVVVGLSHTDSVAAGPGAADAGAGVVAWVDAVGRLAREPLERPFALVLTDGEELGLLGARAFFADPPFPDPIAALVNLEARGTGGASLLFETVGPPLAWGTVLARSGVRPNGSSAYAAVYELLPNDTDLTVVGEHGISGVNHAFLAHLPRYHTPMDDRAHLDARSLAQHADVAWGHVRALQRPPAGRQAFCDVLGLFVLRWPAALSVPLSLAALLGAVAWVGLDLRAGRTSAGALGRALLATVGLFAATIAVAELVGAIAGEAWWNAPRPLRLAAWLVAIAGILPLGQVADPLARWHAVLVPAAVAGVALALVDPRHAVLLLPAVAVALLWRTAGARRPAIGLLGLAPALATAWMPYAFGLEEALTLRHPVAVAAPAWIALAGLAPLLPARLLPASAVLVGLAAVLGLAAARAPAVPFPANLRFVQSPDGTGRVDGPPGLAADGLRLDLPRPLIEREGDRLRIRPARGGFVLHLQAAGPLRLDGQLLPTADGAVELHGVPPEGIVLEAPPGRVVVGEVTSGLPPALAHLAAARAPATPIHAGDRAVVYAVSEPGSP